MVSILKPVKETVSNISSHSMRVHRAANIHVCLAIKRYINNATQVSLHGFSSVFTAVNSTTVSTVAESSVGVTLNELISVQLILFCPLEILKRCCCSARHMKSNSAWTHTPYRLTKAKCLVPVLTAEV